MNGANPSTKSAPCPDTYSQYLQYRVQRRMLDPTVAGMLTGTLSCSAARDDRFAVPRPKPLKHGDAGGRVVRFRDRAHR